MRLSDIPIEATRIQEFPGPPLSALWRGDAARWLRHHVTQPLEGAAQYGFYYLARPLPPEFPAALGQLIGPMAGYLDRKRPYVAQMRRAIGIIRPDLDAAGRAQMLDAWWRNTGISHAQFPTHKALSAPGRLTVHGAARFAEGDRLGNTFYLMVHMGSWEIMSHITTRYHSREMIGIYEPQQSRFQNRLVYAGRKRYNYYVFPPSTQLPRLMIKLFQGGCNGCFFIDEKSAGQSRFPLWGRGVPKTGNVIFLLKLAHKLGARLQPAYLRRESPGRSALHLLDPIPVRSDLPRDVFVRRTVRELSALFEPVIAANLAQWYMLKEMRM
ncbi:MAG: hypothetical protein AAGC92_02790 [Pseudomonadota bacterium]